MNRFVQDPDAVPATYNPMRELVDENLLFHSRRLGIGLIMYSTFSVLCIHIPAYIVAKAEEFSKEVRASSPSAEGTTLASATTTGYWLLKSISSLTARATSSAVNVEPTEARLQGRFDHTMSVLLVVLLAYVIVPFVVKHAKPKLIVIRLTRLWFESATEVLKCREYLLRPETTARENNNNNNNNDDDDGTGEAGDAEEEVDPPPNMALRGIVLTFLTISVSLLLTAAAVFSTHTAGNFALHALVSGSNRVGGATYEHAIAILGIRALDAIIVGSALISVFGAFVYHTSLETSTRLRQAVVEDRAAGVGLTWRKARTLSRPLAASVQWLLAFVTLQFVLPILTGIAINQCFISWIASAFDTLSPSISDCPKYTIFRFWMVGLIAGRLAYDIRKRFFGQRAVGGGQFAFGNLSSNLDALVEAIDRELWKQEGTASLLLHAVLPVTLKLTVFTSTPAALVMIVQQHTSKFDALLPYTQLFILTSCCIVGNWSWLRSRFSKFHDQIKDELYMSGQVLENYNGKAEDDVRMQDGKDKDV